MPPGAPLAGARVVATRTATAAVRETTTDSAGRYALASLAPGEYRVSIEMPGFAPKTLDRVVVEVGRRVPADAVLDVSGGAEAVTVEERVMPVATGSSLVGGVVSSGVVENLPLNGRNFLELAFLFPGNAPAPNFDPTKSNTLAISSAGQLGRGGNITIDGQDNNDDVVGGPLANLPQDAVQEFQMATNRFSAEQGRSAASAVNVVTRSGTDAFSGTATFLYRDDALQGLPATFDRSSGAGAPVLPRAVLGDARRADRARQGLVVRGGRVPQPGRRRPGRRARHRDAHDPPGAGAGAAHRLPRPGARRRARLGERHAQPALRGGRPERHRRPARSTARSAPPRSARRAATSTSRASSTWTRTLGQASVNTLRASYSDYRNSIEPVVPGRQLTFPSVQDGASFRVPQGTTQKRWQVSDSLSWVKGAHTLRFGGEAAHTDGAFDLGVFRDGRVEMVQDFPQFDLNRDGVVNDDDLLFAVTLRSGKPDQDLVLDDCSSTYLAGFVQDDWRLTPQLTLNLGLRYELDTNVKNISGYGDTNPIVAPFYQGTRGRDLDNFGPRVGSRVGEPRGLLPAARRLGALLRPRDARDHVARARARRPRAADRGAGRERVLPRPRDRHRAAVRADLRQSLHRLHPARRRGLRASTSSTTRSRTRRCSSSTSGRGSGSWARPCCSSTSCTTAARTSSSGGRSARSITRWWAAPTAW